MIYSPQQQRALDELLPIVKIATDGSRSNLPLLPRCHSLVIGPSGSGKSFIAAETAKLLGLPYLVINVATWILTAARAEPSTWTQIAGWLDTFKNGGLIIVDEVDKAYGTAEYSVAVRLEIHDLLDGVIPLSAKIPEPSLDFLGACPGETMVYDRSELQRTLRERVMIIGCGAWQSAWRSNIRQLGFASGSCPVADPPGREQILGSIDPELRQRFRDEVCLLPPLVHSDYIQLAKAIATKIPREYRREWDVQVGGAMRKAVEGALGMRVFEELLLKAMILSRRGKDRDLSPDQKRGL